MQNTTHYNLKKPDYTDFADIQDINDNMDTIDAELAAPTGDGRDQTVSFTDADLDSGITSFPTFLTKIVSGMKLAKFLRDFKAGMAYVLHTGSLINNATCTEPGKALDARMGKTLQDQITSLNDSLANKLNNTFTHRSVTNGVVGVPWQSGFKDAIIVAYFGKNTEVRVQFYICAEMLESNNRYLMTGGYLSASDNHLVRIAYNATSVRLANWYWNGTDISSNTSSLCPIHVYERF